MCGIVIFDLSHSFIFLLLTELEYLASKILQYLVKSSFSSKVNGGISFALAIGCGKTTPYVLCFAANSVIPSHASSSLIGCTTLQHKYSQQISLPVCFTFSKTHNICSPNIPSQQVKLSNLSELLRSQKN